MKVFFFPIVPISISVVLGVILYTYYPIALQNILIQLVAIILVYIFTIKLKHSFISSLILLFIWIQIGCLTAYIQTDKNSKKHYTKIISSDKQKIVFTITEKIKSNKKYNRYIAQINELDFNNVKGKVIVNEIKSDQVNLTVGDKIITYNYLHNIQEIKNPYQFSYAAYLSKQNIHAQIYIEASNYKVIGTNKGIPYYVNILRENLIKSFAIHQYSNNTQQFINAFLLGQRQELDKSINDNYTEAGVSHILAISGLHISIVYGILLLIFKNLKMSNKLRYVELICSLIFLWTFALLTGLSPSVVRCVTVFSIIALANALQKNQNTYNAMALALLVIVLFTPNIIFEVGFQLSYLSVLIIVITNPLLKKLHFTSYKIIHYITDLIAISCLVQLFLLPILIYYFKQIPLLFLVSNLLVIPLSTIILYLLVILLILNYIFPYLAIIIGKIVGFLIMFMNDYIAWVASIKGGIIQNIPFNSVLLISSYLLVITIFLLLFKITYKRALYFLSAILLTTISYIFSIENQKNKNSFLVWNVYKQTFISEQNKNSITIYTSDTSNIEPYKNSILQNHFFNKVEVRPLLNYYVCDENKIALINFEKYYNEGIDTDFLILTGSPKINLERVINIYKPKYIICDANNYKSYITKWEFTCKQKNIPFYNTNKMGYFSISN